MDARISIKAVKPAAHQAVYGMEQYVRAHVDPHLLHIVKIRASIMNGCSFCLDMHTREGSADGMDSRKLFALGAWREGSFFDERERAALELTEAVTRLGEHGVTDDVWAGAVQHFGVEGTIDLLMAIATINVWNRLAVSTRQQPPAA